jgi:hypothetical protein
MDKREIFSISLSSLVINTFTQVAIVLELALCSLTGTVTKPITPAGGGPESALEVSG